MCCSRFSTRRSNQRSLESIEFKEPVILNVYDIFKGNNIMAPLGIGVFHTGVEVYGIEFAYAGHEGYSSGIFDMNPRNLCNEMGEGLKYRSSIIIGYTHYSLADVERIIREMGRQFRGRMYHLSSKNCNHFSNELTQILCGKGIPRWINRLACWFSYVPCLQRLVPDEFLRPI